MVLQCYREKAEALPGALSLVTALRMESQRIAVASSSIRPWVEACLGYPGLGNAFETLVTGDQATNGKPDPEIYLMAAEKLGVDPRECLAFEDGAPAGIESAKAAGMTVWAVRTEYTRDLVLPKPRPRIPVPPTWTCGTSWGWRRERAGAARGTQRDCLRRLTAGTTQRPQPRRRRRAAKAHRRHRGDPPDAVGCVILRCAGVRLRVDIKAITSDVAPRLAHFQAIDALQASPQPVIAAVKGHCYTELAGTGAGLRLHRRGRIGAVRRHARPAGP